MMPKTISSINVGTSLFNQAYKEFPLLDGIFCTNDDIAVGALLECEVRGIDVPSQMAIAGFHGLEIGRATTKKLASVITPRFEIGKTAAELLLKKLDGKETRESIDLNYQIYFGDTV